MNNSHTPGPYSLSGIAGDNHIMARTGHERVTVAIIPGWPGITPEEHQANMTLFHAAPDLLEALKLLLANIEEYQRINHLGGYDNQDQRMARAAIAKAKGVA